MIYADYKSAKQVMEALNAGGDFFCNGSMGWLDAARSAGACINLAEMAVLGLRSTGKVYFNRDIKVTCFAIVDGKAVLETSREAKAAQKARIKAAAAAS